MTSSFQRVALLFFLGIASARAALGSPEVPGADQETPIAIVGATIHTVSGPVIEDGTLLLDRGRIVQIGKKVRVPRGAERIDAGGLHVYPGLINAHGQLGLVEISSVRATLDSSETGQINPNVKAQVAVNPDSELIPVTRSGGVLLSLAAPSGGLISGTSALLQLDGWTWEDMTLEAPVGMHVRWPHVRPAASLPSAESSEGRSGGGSPLDLLERTFADARAYRTARAADKDDHPFDARWEAMLPVLEDDLPLVVSADEVQQIQAAVAFADRQNVKLIVLGGYAAPRCAELLKQHDVPVIVSSIHRLPRRSSDAYDAAYTLPERLRAAGVQFCIACGGASNIRNLPYEAATASAYGLPPEEALKAITLYPAQILGVADRVGSLEVGKDATLIVTDGDPLETATHVQQAFIQGRRVDLSDRQKRLWQKYQEKYRRLEKSSQKPEDE